MPIKYWTQQPKSKQAKFTSTEFHDVYSTGACKEVSEDWLNLNNILGGGASNFQVETQSQW